MRRFMICALTAMLLLCGCAQTREDPFKVDTVVQIPVDPTELPTEAPTEPSLPQTEAPTEEPTEPKATEAKKSGSSNKGSGSGGKKTNKETEPPVPDATILMTEAPTEAPTEPPFDPSGHSIGNLEHAIADVINGLRAGDGVEELSLSGKLSGIAWLRAREASVSWSHTRPDGRGYTSALSDYGFGYTDAAELMVYSSGESDAESLVSQWLNSESHKGKLLNGGFDKAGIGVYYDGGVTYVVCLLVG